MGMFNQFNTSVSSKTNLTPRLAFVVSMLLAAGSNETASEEDLARIGLVMLQFCDPATVAQLTTDAVVYLDKGLDTFFEDASNLLSLEQKYSILINVCDLILGDGIADSTEQETFKNFLNEFNVSEDDFEPYFNTLALKYDRSLF